MDIYKFKKLSAVEAESEFSSTESTHLIVEDGGGIKRLDAENKLLPTPTQEDVGKVPVVQEGGAYNLNDMGITPDDIIEATGDMTSEQKAQTRQNIGAGEPLTPEQIAEGAGAWLEDNLATPSTPPIDSSLSVANAAADAKATGEAVKVLREDIFGAPNLADEFVYVDNYMIPANGTPTVNNSFHYVDYVGVVPDEKYELILESNIAETANTRLHGYNGAKTHLSNFETIQTTATGTTIYEITIPSNVEYVRISVIKSISIQSFKRKTEALPQVEITLDDTLSKYGEAADAAAVGHALLKINGAQNSDTDTLNAFVTAMNAKAEAIGMTNSVFADPAGWERNRLTARDAVRLGVACCGCDPIVKTWHKRSHIVKVIGANARDISIVSTVQSAALEDYYVLLGGKTGSSGETVNNSLIAVCEVEGKLVVGAISGATSTSNRFVAMKQLMDAAKQAIKGETVTASVTVATYACCALLPLYNANLYEQYPDFDWLYEKNADTQYIPASNVKLMTALVLGEHCPNLDEHLSFNATDFLGGTGAVFEDGDVITLRDALFAALLPSSNMAAHAIGRYVGNKILNAQTYIGEFEPPVEKVDLPAGFTQLSYIASTTGNEYIDTGYVPNINSEFETTFKGLYSAPSSASNPTPYGLRNNTTGNWLGIYYGVNSTYWGKMNSSFGSVHDAPGDGDANAKPVHCIQNKDGLSVNGDMIATYSTPTFASETLSVFLFMRNLNGSADRNNLMNLYRHKIRDNGTPARDYVPARRDSDNVVGLYEMVSGTFKVNQGSGAFAAGSVVI